MDDTRATKKSSSGHRELSRRQENHEAVEGSGAMRRVLDK